MAPPARPVPQVTLDQEAERVVDGGDVVLGPAVAAIELERVDEARARVETDGVGVGVDGGGVVHGSG